jgi:RsiW-degrading membrane proteinase PrsW (M82 family)
MDPLSAYSGVFIRLGLYILVFWPIVGYYIYVKSKEQELSNPKMRGIVLGFLGIPGLLIHLWNIQSGE